MLSAVWRRILETPADDGDKYDLPDALDKWH
jgi:hypothetical protein